MDGEIAKVALTASASVITTLWAIARYFMGSIKSLDRKISSLSETISKLDKNIAVQAAVFKLHVKSHVSKGEAHNGYNRNKEVD